MTEQEPDEPDNYENLAQALGMFVMAFNELEVALGGALMHLLGQDDQTGAVFVGHLSAGAKLKLLRALEFKIPEGSLKDQFVEVLAQAEEINTERNRFVHSEYFLDVDNNRTLHRRLRDAHMPVSYPVTIHQTSKILRMANPDDVAEWADMASMWADELLKLGPKLRP